MLSVPNFDFHYQLTDSQAASSQHSSSHIPTKLSVTCITLVATSPNSSAKHKPHRVVKLKELGPPERTKSHALTLHSKPQKRAFKHRRTLNILAVTIVRFLAPYTKYPRTFKLPNVRKLNKTTVISFILGLQNLSESLPV
jgi:hypothetical protein